MGVEIQLFEVGAHRSDFCLWGWMKSEVYKEKVNTRDFCTELTTKSGNKCGKYGQKSTYAAK
jgi:hypothetical protein